MWIIFFRNIFLVQVTWR